MMSMMGIVSMIFWIIVLGLVIYGVMLLILKPFEKEKNSSEEDEAMAILKERFAKGEIDQQEFEERKAILINS